MIAHVLKDLERNLLYVSETSGLVEDEGTEGEMKPGGRKNIPCLIKGTWRGCWDRHSGWS